MNLSTSWKAYLENHPDVKKLCMILDKLQGLMVINRTETNFKILESSPSTIIITFDCAQNSIIPSFLHSSIGNGLLDDDISMIGLTGLSQIASPILLN